MFHRLRSRAVSASALALVAATAGVAGSRLLAADKPQQQAAAVAAQNHTGDITPHLGMAQDAEGAKMIKESMTMMLAHQVLLHDLQDHPESKQVLQAAMKDPKVAAIVQQVKAEMGDPAKRAAKVAEVKKDHKEMMMVLAHALMRQDEDLKKLMKEDHEAGKH